MPWQMAGGFSLNVRSVLNHAPAESGVYLIYSPAGWIYIGESADMRASLLQHVKSGNIRLAQATSALFAVECIPAESRAARQRELIWMLEPVSQSPRKKSFFLSPDQIGPMGRGPIADTSRLSMN